MRSSLYNQLCATARRESRVAHGAEDLVQEALLAAVLAGRTDFEAPQTVRWLSGVVRNQARMAARSAVRRRGRETRWHDAACPEAGVEKTEVAKLLSGLPPALKSLAALSLSGHSRHEIAYLLSLTDTALRQRIVALKRHVVAAGLAAPSDLPGLTLDLAYGRIRETLLAHLLASKGTLASHDPDGHLFVIRRSQKPGSRQQDGQTQQEGSP